MCRIVRFFDVVDERNDLPYAFYFQKIVWNVKEIAEYESANGFIVQKVCYNDTVGATFSTEAYYEAWQVCNGVCERTDSYNYDDAFASPDSFESYLLDNSIGKRGFIRYDALVYWIDAKSGLYKTVSMWERGKVKMAGGLKSTFVSDCPELQKITYRFSRKFTHNIDCVSEEAVETSIINVYQERLSNGDLAMRGVLQDHLVGTAYESLIDKICMTYHIG